MPSNTLLADSSPVLASKSCATCALNTPMVVYRYKLREVRGGANIPPHIRAKVVHKGAGLYLKLYSNKNGQMSTFLHLPKCKSPV